MQFIDLNKQFSLLKEKINDRINNVLNHGQYIMGPEVSELESKLGIFTNSRNTITCSSGTDALLMSLMALNVKPGDYIITTPFTYIATAEVMSLMGAIPEFVDIDPKTFNIDIAKIEEKLYADPDKYSVVMPVNIFGLPADHKSLYTLRDKYNFKIIEDAAQSFGASANGKMSCNLGDVNCTSFFPAKPLGCYGDGGAIFTNDDNISEILKSIRVHGMGKDKYHNIRIGINGRLDTIQAAILLPKLEILSEEIKSRNIVAEKYNSKLANHFTTQYVPDNYISSWAQYSILCSNSDERQDIMEKLNMHNIPTAIYYLVPLHLQEVYKNLNYSMGDFPVSEDISTRILSLPMHPYLSMDDIEQICKLILENKDNFGG